MDEQDRTYLQRALDLAERGRGLTSPNPIVGAVIVREGAVLGEGWHAGAGLDHAEIAAIRDALGRAGRDMDARRSPLDESACRAVCAGATIYVSLEPCCTQGRTPPCTAALVASGFSKVVAAALDPSPQVDGQGLKLLAEAGVTVELAEGTVADRARRQNNGLRKIVTKGLPFVEYKYALTLDGRVATDSGDSKWISSADSRELVHLWRSWADAVVVGTGTLRADDPTLTARGVDCVRQPTRVVVGATVNLEADSNLVRSLSEGPVLAVCARDMAAEKLEALEALGVETETVDKGPDGHLEPGAVCRALAARGLQTVFLEGGPRLAGAWWAAGMVDKVSAFICPKLAAGERPAGALLSPGAPRMDGAPILREVEVTQVGPDVLVRGFTGGPF